MKIKKVTLIKNGYGGVAVSGEMPIVKDNITIRAEVKQFMYKIPIPDELKRQIDKLKKYILDIYGYWKPEHEKYIERGELVEISNPEQDYYEAIEMLQKTNIVSIEIKGAAIVIEAFIRNGLEMVLPLKSPGVSPNDNYPKYDKLFKGTNFIFGKVNDFIEAKALVKMDSKQYVMHLQGDDPDKVKQIENLDKEDLNNEMTKMLEREGYIVINHNELEEAVSEEAVIEDEKIENLEDVKTETDDKSEGSIEITEKKEEIPEIDM